MTFRALYDDIQLLAAPVGRNLIVDRVQALMGVKVRFARVDLDLTVCRGMYLTPQNGTHRLVEQMGGANVVAFGRDLNRCWERFVIVKELMHVFDQPGEQSDTGDKFEEVLRAFAQESPGARSPQMNSEIVCFWRALLVLCPQAVRDDYIARMANGTTPYETALALRIPEQYIPWLSDPRFSRNRDIIVGV